METRFYSGNYSLNLGQPYAIISAEEKEKEFFAEEIIIFHSFNEEVIVIGQNTTYPKLTGITLEDFITSELQVCKDRIFYKILYKKYHEQLERLLFNVNIQLVETNETILSFFRDKFPKALQKIRDKTINKKLKALIKLYQSIVIERNDFDIFGNISSH